MTRRIFIFILMLLACSLPQLAGAVTLPDGFFEDFNDGAANNWKNDGTGAWSVSANRYQAAANTTLNVFFSHYKQDYADFTYAVDVRKTAGHESRSMGIIFRTDGSYKNGYVFHINARGYYLIFKKVGGRTVYLIPGWTFSGAINRGIGAKNRLQVECIGGDMSFTINGTVVEQLITDTSFASGRVGVKAFGSAYRGDNVQFDNAELNPYGMAPGMHVSINRSSRVAGDYNGCGSYDDPCKTITDALNELNSNEASAPVYVEKGLYNEAAGEYFPLYLYWDTPIICGGPNHSTIIDIDWGTGIVIYGSNAGVTGCTIRNGSPAIADGDWYNAYPTEIRDNIIEGGCVGIKLYADSTVAGNKIRNMEAYDCDNNAIYVSGAFGNISPLIENNKILNNQYIHGIVIESASPVIRNNKIAGNDSGIYFYDYTNESMPVINNNILSCNSYSDLESDTYASIDARDNAWDHVPPAEGCGGGADVCNWWGGSIDLTGATLAPDPCKKIIFD